MIDRSDHLAEVKRLLRHFPVVALIGPRQAGKTTLAKVLASSLKVPVTEFDLENPRDVERLREPMGALEKRRGVVILDEVQRRPELFPVLRVLADRPRGPRFLVLGSASPELLRQSSESLAGRIAYHVLDGLTLAEVGERNLDKLWLRGGFPRSFTATSDVASAEWLRQFAQTFLERDIPQLGLRVSASTLQRFWSMLAHWHGQVLNSSELARSLGVSDTAIRHYLDVLTGTFMVRQLRPWFQNIAKRQVKAPKIYIADSGVLHSLLGIEGMSALERHPKLGASWEGFCIQEVIARLGAREREVFFWATHSGAELDLVVVRGTRRLGFEIKRSDAPTLTPSMRHALIDLELDRLDVIYPGEDTYPLAPRVRAVAMTRLRRDVAKLR